jgi:uncharacterized protein
MASANLLALLDDIATLLDDIAVMSKVAAKRTAGVLGDDLALNAEQVAGVRAERELPVVWAVMKGSFRNKAILVPAALLISAVAPWAITPLLLAGGAFLCFEGAEKVFHRWHKPTNHEPAPHLAAIADPSFDAVAFEADKIKGAIRTDFILSAEVIVIALGASAGATLTAQFGVLTVVAIAMTLGVYGFVAGIVKLDDLGLILQRRGGASAPMGALLLALAPRLMKLLSWVGTLAMFLVGGGIVVHSFPAVDHIVGGIALLSGGIPHVGLVLDAAMPTIAGGVIGFALGCALLLLVWASVKLYTLMHSPRAMR